MKSIPVLFIIFVFFIKCSAPPSVKTVPDQNEIPGKKDKLSGNKTINGSDEEFYQVGIASWYGGKFNGRRTSNGEIYDMYKLTAAHKELPFNTIVEIENLSNRKKVIVRINDRGPFVKDRIIDLSLKAAISIDMDDVGTAPVVLRIVDLVNSGKGEKIVVRKINYSHRSEFFLQAGAFTQLENAESLMDKLNYYLKKTKFRIKPENGYHKVISAKILSREEAERMKRSLEGLGFDTFIKEVFLTGEKK